MKVCIIHSTRREDFSTALTNDKLGSLDSTDWTDVSDEEYEGLKLWCLRNSSYEEQYEIYKLVDINKVDIKAILKEIREQKKRQQEWAEQRKEEMEKRQKKEQAQKEARAKRRKERAIEKAKELLKEVGELPQA